MSRITLSVGMLTLAVAGGWAVSAAGQQGGLDVLVVPARYTTLQLAFDLADRRDIVLVGYQNAPATARTVLHVWDGVEWIPLSAESYARFDFTRVPPRRIVLIGDEETLPRFLVDDALASPAERVVEVASQSISDILNALGPLYRFRSTEWEWFGSRYRLGLADANEDVRQRSWYDQDPSRLDRSEAPWNRRKAKAAAETEELAIAPAPAEGPSSPPEAAELERERLERSVEPSADPMASTDLQGPSTEPAPDTGSSLLMQPETVFEAPIK